MSASRPPRSPAVLVVDDSGYARLRARRLLSALGFTDVAEAADGEAALAAFEELHPSLVLVDHVMRGRDGIEVATELLRRDPGVRIVMLTVVSDPEVHSRARRAGISAVLTKGDEDGLRAVLSEVRGA